MAYANNTDKRRSGALVAASTCAMVLAGWSSAAYAQEDVQGSSVSERFRPEYSRRPVRAGNLDIFPEVEVSSEYNDNIYALNTNEIDDVILTVRPSVLVRDQRPDRTLSLRLTGGFRKYVDNGSEDAAQLLAVADARFGQGTLTRYYAGAEANRNTEQRRSIDSFSSTVDPVVFTSYRANFGVDHDIGRITVSAEVSGRSVDYQGTTKINGTEYDLGFRDFTVYSGRGRVSYSPSGTNRVYAQVVYDDRSYNSGTGAAVPAFNLDRSSNGGRIEVGYSQQVTELFFFDARVGYLFRNYDDPSLPNVNGLAFEGNVLWNVTPLTSIEFTGIRRVDETVNPLLSGLLRTEFQGRVDHEILRNLVLTAQGRYAHLTPIGDAFKINEWEASLGAMYLLNRFWTLTFSAEHFERRNNFNLKQNRAIIGIRYNF